MWLGMLKMVLCQDGKRKEEKKEARGRGDELYL